MKQQTFSDYEYSNRKRKTKREEFLEIMDEIIPWDEWISVIVPYYPSGKRGRPPIGIEIKLRMYLLQVWFNLSDEGTEDAIYDSYAMRKFVGINFLEEDVPDATTLLKFRRLLEKHGLNKLFFEAINRVMVETGHMLKGGSVVDATIINAPSSTKNAQKQRDPDAHSVKKGNAWHFGYKAHVGVDKDSGLAHTVEVTGANTHDVTMTPKLLTGEEEAVYGDSGYLGAEKREEAITRNTAGKKIKYKINRRPSQSKNRSTRSKGQIKRREHEKSSVRAKVEHIFAVVKGRFRYRKTRYRGLRKQTAKLNMLFALANLVLADRPCLAA